MVGTIVITLLLIVIVLGGSLAFFIWAAQYFGRWAYRRATRFNLYVPVTASVTRVEYSRPATLHVEYEFRGTTIKTRFGTSTVVARLADQSKQIALLIDPEYPEDVAEDPKFIEQADEKASTEWKLPFGARTFLGFALIFLGCVVGGGVLALGIIRLQNGRIDPLAYWIVITLLSVKYVIGLLLVWSRMSEVKQRECPQK